MTSATSPRSGTRDGQCDPSAGPAIFVNDERRALTATLTIADLVAELGLVARKGIAVAVNGTVAPRATWPRRSLSDGERVLIIRATQGG